MDDGPRDHHLDDGRGSEVDFHGELLGEATSRNGTHAPRAEHVDGLALRGEKCSACRWFEVRIYRVSSSSPTTEYVVETVGRTEVPGERTRTRIERTDAPHWVIECLVQRRDGDVFIPTVSRRALAQVATRDRAIEDAFINRVVA